MARQRMEEALRAREGGGAAKPAPAAAAKAAAAAAKAGEDPFGRQLTAILSSSGGVVQERHAAQLLSLASRARSKPHRTALLAVLQLSAPGVLRAAVAGKLLLHLQAWLSDFISEGKPLLVQQTLACLDHLPVTLDALKPPCGLGKVVGGLRKHAGFGSAVQEPAKRLVAKWKAMMPPTKPAAAAAAATGAATTPAAAAGAAAAPARSARPPAAAACRCCPLLSAARAAPAAARLPCPLWMAPCKDAWPCERLLLRARAEAVAQLAAAAGVPVVC